MTRLWIVSREVRLEAGNGLLAKEKRLTRLRDELAAERRALPRVRIVPLWPRLAGGSVSHPVAASTRNQ